MQDGLVSVLAGAEGKDLIGQVTKFNPRTGELRIKLTDQEVIQELVDSKKIWLGLTMREVRGPKYGRRDSND